MGRGGRLCARSEHLLGALEVRLAARRVSTSEQASVRLSRGDLHRRGRSITSASSRRPGRIRLMARLVRTRRLHAAELRARAESAIRPRADRSTRRAVYRKGCVRRRCAGSVRSAARATWSASVRRPAAYSTSNEIVVVPNPHAARFRGRCAVFPPRAPFRARRCCTRKRIPSASISRAHRTLSRSSAASSRGPYVTARESVTATHDARMRRISHGDEMSCAVATSWRVPCYGAVYSHACLVPGNRSVARVRLRTLLVCSLRFAVLRLPPGRWPTAQRVRHSSATGGHCEPRRVSRLAGHANQV